jgi:hypothetical protein
MATLIGATVHELAQVRGEAGVGAGPREPYVAAAQPASQRPGCGEHDVLPTRGPGRRRHGCRPGRSSRRVAPNEVCGLRRLHVEAASDRAPVTLVPQPARRRVRPRARSAVPGGPSALSSARARCGLTLAGTAAHRPGPAHVPDHGRPVAPPATTGLCWRPAPREAPRPSRSTPPGAPPWTGSPDSTPRSASHPAPRSPPPPSTPPGFSAAGDVPADAAKPARQQGNPRPGGPALPVGNRGALPRAGRRCRRWRHRPGRGRPGATRLRAADPRPARKDRGSRRSLDLARADRVELELDQLVDHLSAAFGLAGRRRSTGSAVERARSAVAFPFGQTLEGFNRQLEA